MPLYEYKCTADRCQRITIKLFFGSEERLTETPCEHCGDVALRTISAPSFRVKQGQCGNAESGYSDVRNVKPMDQKRNMSRAQDEADKLNRGQNPR
jgi:putative FmdB family regulatory protein